MPQARHGDAGDATQRDTFSPLLPPFLHSHFLEGKTKGLSWRLPCSQVMVSMGKPAAGHLMTRSLPETAVILGISRM